MIATIFIIHIASLPHVLPNILILHRHIVKMPTFYACKTTIQLSVADITRATTPNPRSVQCPEASQNIRSTAQEFARGSKDGTLTETPLLTEDGSHIRFLGKHQDMPFFMVHAGKTFFELDASEKRNRRPARVPLGGPAPATPTQGNGTNTGIDVSNKGKVPFSRHLKPCHYSEH